MHVATFQWLAQHEWNSKLLEQVIDILQKGPLRLALNSNASITASKVPDSLRYHTIEVFFAHLKEACLLLKENDAAALTLYAVQALFQPFVEYLRKTDNERILKHVFEDILDHYGDEEGLEAL
jgi:hypothetical protein